MLIELSTLLLVAEVFIQSFEWIKTGIISDHLTYIESPPDLWFQTREIDYEII